MDPNPLTRNTFWTVTIGMTFIWLSHVGVNQGMMQRFLALPTLSDARWALLVFCVGICWCKSVSCLTGLLIYARYHDCDPLSTKTIKRADQLLPYYVMDVAGSVPGLPGLFIAGVFCAALSSMSTSLNTLSGTIYEDFLSRWLPTDKQTEGVVNFVMKLTVCVVGVICVVLVFWIERLGSVVQVAATVSGVTYGAMLGLFSLGMFFPWANTKGALVGGLTSLVFVGWLVIGAQAEIARGAIKFQWKPMSTDGCVGNLTHTVPALFAAADSASRLPHTDEPFLLFRLSYLYFNVLGFIAAVAVGLLVSFLTGATSPRDLHPDLLSPVVHWMLPKSNKHDYQPVKQTVTVASTR